METLTTTFPIIQKIDGFKLAIFKVGDALHTTIFPDNDLQRNLENVGRELLEPVITKIYDNVFKDRVPGAHLIKKVRHHRDGSRFLLISIMHGYEI